MHAFLTPHIVLSTLVILVSCVDKGPSGGNLRSRELLRRRPQALPQALVDAQLHAARGTDCTNSELLGVDRTLIGPLFGCRTRVADTIVFFYSREDGAVLLIGHDFSVPPQRLSQTADSVQQVLTSQFGEPARCTATVMTGRNVQRHFRWRAPAYEIDLVARTPYESTDSSVSAFINVQFRAVAGSCETVMPPPIFAP